MPIIYRTDGPWGAGVPFDLTAEEIDGNFFDLDTRVTDIEENPPEAIGIDHFEVIGFLLYVHMTNYEVLGPYQLPRRDFVPRGVWTPETAYQIDDFVSFAGVLYIVTFDHTSEEEFDPGANDGEGHDYYAVVFEAPETAIPDGGFERQVLGKLSDTPYHIGWIDGLLPDGGATGDILYKASGADGDAEWAPPALVAGLVTTALTFSGNSRTLRATTVDNPTGDEYRYFLCANSTLSTIRIPLNSLEPFEVDVEITFRAENVGQVVFTADSVGVTIRYPDAFLPRLYGRGAVATIKHVETDVWDVFGLLAPA